MEITPVIEAFYTEGYCQPSKKEMSWKTMKDYDDYQVSSCGNIRKVGSNHLLTIYHNSAEFKKNESRVRIFVDGVATHINPEVEAEKMFGKRLRRGYKLEEVKE